MLPDHQQWRRFNNLESEECKSLTNRFFDSFKVNRTKLEPPEQERRADTPAEETGAVPRNVQALIEEVKTKKWRNAGPLSHQRSAAAMSYVMLEHEDGTLNLFGQVGDCIQNIGIEFV